MRRYQKAGRLTEQLHYLPHGAQLAAAKCASEIGAIMSRSCRTGNFSAAWRRHVGLPIVEFDIRHGE
eukprot:118962-Pyramimonas_sp.AAC.1